MSNLVLALVIVAVVVAMIISQVKGVTLSGRRMLLLPAILIGFGAVNLAACAASARWTSPASRAARQSRPSSGWARAGPCTWSRAAGRCGAGCRCAGCGGGRR